MKNIPLYEVRPIKNLKDMLQSSVALYGDRTAFLSKHGGSGRYIPITYNQFKTDVDALGTVLTKLGLKGKRVALIGESRYEWMVSYLSVVNGVGVIVPLDKELPENEIESLISRSEANAVIYSGGKQDSIAAIAGRISTVDFYINMDAKEDSEKNLSFSRLLEEGRSLVSGGERAYLDAEIDAEELNILLFTSGTTNTSKAVMLTHKNICTNLESMCSMLYIGKEDIFLSILPIHHTYECTCGILCPIYRGACVAFSEGLRHIPKNLKESKTTVMLGVPLIFEAFYRRIWDQVSKDPAKLKKLKLGLKISNLLKKFGKDISRKLFAELHDNFGGNIKIFISGAAGIDPAVAKGFRELGFGFVQGYGLTECSPIVALNRDVDFKDDAAGLPLPGLQVKIDSPSSDGVGEIIVQGPSVMSGYYRDEEATKAVFKDGWFYTGDLGFIDSDGFVHITGRKKNVIVTKNGKNIFPEEIESLLNKSPYIQESLVYGEEEKDASEVTVSAAVFPDMEKIKEAFPDKEITADFIYELVRNEVKDVNKQLVTYKYIKNIDIRETEFAKTTTKKIKRYLETRS